MRFLMVTSFYPPHSFGGDATYVRQLSRALVALGHHVQVIACYDAYRISGGTHGPDAEDGADGVAVARLMHRFGRLSPLISQQFGAPGLKKTQLARFFARPFDVVHFHNISLMGGPDVLKMSRAPVTLLTAHDHWLVCANHIFWKNNTKACDARTCIRCQIASHKPPQFWRHTGKLARALMSVDRIFAPSEFTRKKLLEQGIARPIEIRPLFAPMAFETQAPRKSPARPYFVYVGRVTRSKGIDRFAALFRARPQYDLRIVGDGDLLEALKAEYRDLPNVIFEGRLEQTALRELYRDATAGILPSIAPETFGLTTIEAFSQNTPVIVRAAGGGGDPVRESGAGFVYESDAKALEAMDRLAGDAAMRDKLGRAGRAAFLAKYTQEIHLTQYLDDVAALGSDHAARPAIMSQAGAS